MTQFDLAGIERTVESSEFTTNGRTFEQTVTPAKNPAPAGKPLAAPKVAKATKPTAPAKAPAKTIQPPVKSDKAVSDSLHVSVTKAIEKAFPPKSGKVETSLTPAEKTKRQAQLETITADIRKETGHIANSYLTIGYKLWIAKEHKLYAAVEVDGKPLKNIYEYGETAFGFKKSSIINFIAVCEKFSVHTPTGLPTDKIDPAFAMFGYTQLSEMLLLPVEKLSNVTPGMTKNDIRSLKSDQPAGQSDGESDPDSDQDEKPEPKVCFSGECNDKTWDSILEKLDKKCRGHKIVITLY